jgi:protein-S-isoprenylcysteine O-methyltransferase Ste14
MQSLRAFGGKLKPRGILRDIVLILALLTLHFSRSTFTAGLAVFGLGAIMHFWSKGCLMRNWVVTTCGPYRLVRHPYYLAAFLVDFGICLMSGNPYLVALYLPAFLLVYLPVIREEERELLATHKEAYREYSLAVPRLLPYKLHRLIGPLDFSWANLRREHEFSRLLRVLAAPLYILMVHLAQTMPAHDWIRSVPLLSLAGAAVLLNVISLLVRWDPFDDLADLCPAGGSDRMERLARRHPWLLAIAGVMRKAQLYVGIALVAVSLAETFYLRERPFDLTQVNGWVLLGLGLIGAGFVALLGVLGAGVDEGRLPATGAYALCRHPAQLGLMLVVAGFCVLMRDWHKFAIWGAFLAAFCPAAIMAGEMAMAEGHGMEYRDYRARVPLLLPLGSTRGASFSLKRAMRKGGAVLAIVLVAGLVGVDRLATIL